MKLYIIDFSFLISFIRQHRYLPPEYFMHGIVDEKTDVYAYGVLLLELITGRKALDNSQQSLIMWVSSKQFQPSLTETKPSQVETFLSGKAFARQGQHWGACGPVPLWFLRLGADGACGLGGCLVHSPIFYPSPWHEPGMSFQVICRQNLPWGSSFTAKNGYSLPSEICLVPSPRKCSWGNREPELSKKSENQRNYAAVLTSPFKNWHCFFFALRKQF